MQNYLADDGLLIFGDGSRYTKAEFLKAHSRFQARQLHHRSEGRGQGLEPGRRHLALPDHLRQRHEGRQGGHAQGDLGQHLRPPQRQMVERALSGDSDPMKILVIHGAGMNMRGKAQVEIFGPMTLPEYDAGIRAYAQELGIEVEIFHSNIEGEVINRLFAAHDEGIAGAIINPAGLHARLSGPGRRHRQRRLSDDRGPYLQSGPARRRFGGGDELSRHRVRLRHRRLRARPARTEGAGESLKRCGCCSPTCRWPAGNITAPGRSPACRSWSRSSCTRARRRSIRRA